MSKLPIKRKTITLRPRRNRDEGFLRMVYETSRDEETKDVIWNNPQHKETFFRQQFDMQSLHFKNFYSDADYDIIEYKGKPVGRLILSWESDHLHCVDIAILPRYRKQQIGSAIMDAIVRELNRRKIPATLMYQKWKPYLEKFYELYGFKTTKEHPAHFEMKRERGG